MRLNYEEAKAIFLCLLIFAVLFVASHLVRNQEDRENGCVVRGRK